MTKNEELERLLGIQLDWLKKCLDARVENYFQNSEETPFTLPEFPEIESELIHELVGRKEVELGVWITILLSLAPMLRPELLDILFSDNPNLNRRFSEFGGSQDGNQAGGFVPTVQTALFLMAGSDLPRRLRVMRMFRADHYLFKERILETPERGFSGVVVNTPLRLTASAVNRLLWGEDFRPDYHPDFPAKQVKTTMNWSDLVLSENVMNQVMEIRSWMEHEEQIKEEWGLGKILKPGYRALFHGPPGTGKTLTAGLLGETLSRAVYRIDLSMVVSKYIGETEKNLAGVFDQAENENWVLFFDEADALFGKRTQTQSSNDRHANQEVSYLLQRVEDFPGLVILASNFKGNVDEAFVRRFQSFVYFPIPNPRQRLRLWQNSFGTNLSLDPKVDLEKIAERHELTGGEIVNVVRTVAIAVASRREAVVQPHDLETAIRKEFQKDGRMMS